MSLSLPYPSLDFVPLDVLTAEELNQMVANYTYISNQFPIAQSNLTTAVQNQLAQIATMQTQMNNLIMSYGEVWSPRTYIECNGHLTTSKTDLTFTIPIGKDLSSRSSCTVSGLYGTIRAVGGESDTKTLTSYVANVLLGSNNTVHITCRNSSGWGSSLQNNGPVTVTITTTTRLIFY